VEGHLEALRTAELEIVRTYFRPGVRVLEIGGGSGHQARTLAAWGCDVISLDVANRPTPMTQFHDVRTYDGVHIPFPDSTFDVVYSSNVLEHLQRPADLCTEMRRVLVSGGIAIHFIPTPAWRFWTSLAHYPHLVRRLVTRLQTPPTVRADTPPSTSGPLRMGRLLRRALLAGAHGEYSNPISELYYFRRRRWSALLCGSGLELMHVGGNGLFYTGYALFPTLSLNTRRIAARFLGSSCHVFILRST